MSAVYAEGVKRPGISDTFLAAAGCGLIDADRCAALYGFRAEGIAIPFCHPNGSPIMDDGFPFARVRLSAPVADQKYSQRPGSWVHIYVPPGFNRAPSHARLILVEGEFVSLALAEAGFAALWDQWCGANVNSGEWPARIRT